jgi:hypothetical protein
LRRGGRGWVGWGVGNLTGKCLNMSLKWMKTNLKDDLGGIAVVPFGRFAVEISLFQILKNYGNYLVPVKMLL